MAKEYTHVDGEEGATFTTYETVLAFTIEELMAAEHLRDYITQRAAEVATEMIVNFESQRDNLTPVEGQ